jgi:hypothetical protein
MVTIDETLLYQYHPETNNQWSGGIVAHPAPPQKIPSAKILWKYSRLNSIFWNQDSILQID